MPSPNPVFKVLFALLAVDAVLIEGWLLWVRPTPDVAIIEVYAVPLLFALNAITEGALLLGKRPHIAVGFFLNALLAGGVFHLLLHNWYDHDRHARQQRYSFAQGGHRYEITLDTKRNWFDLSDITERPKGWTTSLMMGEYVVRHDSVLLQQWGGPKQCRIYRRTLVGFKGSAVPIPLRLQE